MRVIILGGGFGGLNAARKLAKKVKDHNVEIVLISNQQHFLFRPSLIWVPFGEREISDIKIPLRPILEDIGVQCVQDQAERVFPKKNEVVLESGKRLQYDFLIIATGATPDYEKIKGLKGNTCSIYDAQGASQTKDRLQNCADEASFVVGIAQGNPAPAIGYEFLFELEAYAQRRSLNARISFFTYENDLLEQAGEKASKVLKEHMEEKEIAYYCDVTLESASEKEMRLSNGKSLLYDLSVALPPYRGADYIFNSPDLDHSEGFIQVNSYLQSIQWENIFAVGDANRFIDKKVLKNGRAAELQANIAAANVASIVLGKTDLKKYENSLLLLTELGSDGAMLSIKYPGLKLSPISRGWAVDGKILHLMKTVYEKYYLWKMK